MAFYVVLQRLLLLIRGLGFSFQLVRIWNFLFCFRFSGNRARNFYSFRLCRYLKTDFFSFLSFFFFDSFLQTRSFLSLSLSLFLFSTILFLSFSVLLILYTFIRNSNAIDNEAIFNRTNSSRINRQFFKNQSYSIYLYHVRIKENHVCLKEIIVIFYISIDFSHLKSISFSH